MAGQQDSGTTEVKILLLLAKKEISFSGKPRGEETINSVEQRTPRSTFVSIRNYNSYHYSPRRYERHNPIGYSSYQQYNRYPPRHERHHLPSNHARCSGFESRKRRASSRVKSTEEGSNDNDNGEETEEDEYYEEEPSNQREEEEVYYDDDEQEAEYYAEEGDFYSEFEDGEETDQDETELAQVRKKVRIIEREILNKKPKNETFSGGITLVKEKDIEEIIEEQVKEAEAAGQIIDLTCETMSKTLPIIKLD
eukprot:maker-scaffold_9-snap-gene-11.16-mRNA-1 protein AED:0.29 eAED:0.34 QI:0/0/0/1/0/0.5/2/373/251